MLGRLHPSDSDRSVNSAADWLNGDGECLVGSSAPDFLEGGESLPSPPPIGPPPTARGEHF